MADSSQPSVDPDRPSNAILNNHRSSVPSGNDRGDDREALELHEIQTREDDELNYSSPSASSGEEVRVTTRRTRSRASVTSAHQGKHPWSRVCHFWTHNVTLTVPQKSNRDHFGKLMKERPVQFFMFIHLFMLCIQPCMQAANGAFQPWNEHSSPTSALPWSLPCKGC